MSSSATFSLENILGDQHDTIEHPTLNGNIDDDQDSEEGLVASEAPPEGYCIECEGPNPLN